MNWYKFMPVDTLFFRGAEPMSMGENHTVSHIFPPPPHTLAGAIRTAVLIQNDISFSNYGKGNVPQDIIDAIGKAGELAPFSLIGPFFNQADDTYVPAPYSWFMEKTNSKIETIRETAVVRGKLIESSLLKTEARPLVWAKGGKKEMVSLGGMWLKHQDLDSKSLKIEIKTNESFFKDEHRTGIALEKSRKARKGHLYSFIHSRLQKDVSLVFGIDKHLPLADKGVFKVGAEQRFGWYEKIELDLIPKNHSGDSYLALSVTEGTEEANDSVIATGRIIYLGGWDLKKRFHKPMKGFYPAGTVFNKKLNNCVAIKGVESC